MNITIKDIARESGYAISTVSRALNNHPDVSPEAKAKIQEIVARYGFVQNSNARHLKAQRSKSVCIIVKGFFNMFLASVLELIQSEIASSGYHAEVQYIDEDANEIATAKQLARENKPVGIIFLGCNVELFKEQFSDLRLPCVLATTVPKELSFSNLSMVGVDDERAAMIACRYLLGNGHRKIGIIGGDRGFSYISALRYKGFCRALSEAGLAFLDEYYQTALFSMEDGYKAMQRLLACYPQITAVFCMSDLIAIGAMRAAYEAGRSVPKDVSVLGFDGLHLGKYYIPSLASIRQPQQEIARKSVSLLFQQVKGQAARTVILDAALIEGSSVRSV